MLPSNPQDLIAWLKKQADEDPSKREFWKREACRVEGTVYAPPLEVPAKKRGK